MFCLIRAPDAAASLISRKECGENGRKFVSQGKSHVKFVEAGGKLYFATHLG